MGTDILTKAEIDDALALLQALGERNALALALLAGAAGRLLPLVLLLGDGGGRLAQAEALGKVAEVELPNVQQPLDRLEGGARRLR